MPGTEGHTRVAMRLSGGKQGGTGYSPQFIPPHFGDLEESGLCRPFSSFAFAGAKKAKIE